MRVYHVVERPQLPMAPRAPLYAHQDPRRRAFTPKSTKGAGRVESALAALLERLARNAVRNLILGPLRGQHVTGALGLGRCRGFRLQVVSCRP